MGAGALVAAQGDGSATPSNEELVAIIRAMPVADISEALAGVDPAQRQRVGAVLDSLSSSSAAEVNVEALCEEDLLKERVKALEEEIEVLKRQKDDVRKELEATGMMRAERLPCMRAVALSAEPPSALEVLQSKVEDLEQDKSDLQGDIESTKEAIDKCFRTLQIEIGGDPHTHSGFDNGGSTGYSWSYDVADKSVVQVLETNGGGRDTTTDGRCGGGRDFAYEFHGVSVGVSKVTILHGRSFDPSSCKKTSLKLNVVQPEDVQMEERLSKARTRFDELAASLKEKRPDEGGSAVDQIDETSPGLQIFTLRKASYLLENRLEAVATEDEQKSMFAELKVKEDALDFEEQQHESKKFELKKQINALQDELQDVTGCAIECMAEMCVARCGMMEMVGEDPVSKRKRELEERAEELQGRRDELTDLETQLAEATEQLKKAKDAKVEAPSS